MIVLGIFYEPDDFLDRLFKLINSLDNDRVLSQVVSDAVACIQEPFYAFVLA